MDPSTERLRGVLREAVENPEVRAAISGDIARLRERYELTDGEVAALQRADILVLGTIPGSVAATFTTSPITITVTTKVPGFDSGDPAFTFPLEDMDPVVLAATLKRALQDEEFAGRVRQRLIL
jgi:hypothetical protein